jgi:hypothetical protein
MSDGPMPDDFRAKVFRDRAHNGDWRVEKLDKGESIEIAIFSGRGRLARRRTSLRADRPVRNPRQQSTKLGRLLRT